MQNDVYAFWKYDIYPHLLGAKVIEEVERGKVKIEGYNGYIFQYQFLLMGESGKELLSTLRWLKGEFEYDKQKLRKQYVDNLNHNLRKYSVNYQVQE